MDTDGDGKVTSSDVAEWGKRLLTVLKVKSCGEWLRLFR